MNTTIVKSFHYPTFSIVNKTTSKNLCQKYCGSIGKCWGCVHQFDDINWKWTAITRFHMVNESNVSKVAMKVETTQRPSKYKLLAQIKIARFFEYLKFHLIFLYMLQNIECITVKVEIGSHQDEHLFDRTWKMGKCYGPRPFLDRFHESNKGVRYEDNNIYMDVCCLTPGDYLLECKNVIGPYGWGNGYLEIMGQRYCDDFYDLELSGISK